MTCPNCKSDDWKLASLVFNEGLSTSQSVTTGVGVSTGGVGVGVAKSAGINQSNLSILAAPPVDPRPNIISCCGILGAIIMGAVFYLSGGFIWMLAGLVIGTFIGAIASLLIPNTDYEMQHASWLEVKMCTRCGSFYSSPKEDSNK